jgi:hypothetical protein
MQLDATERMPSGVPRRQYQVSARATRKAALMESGEDHWKADAPRDESRISSDAGSKPGCNDRVSMRQCLKFEKARPRSPSAVQTSIVAPTNSAVWRLRVQVSIEDPYSSRRFAEILKMRRAGLGKGSAGRPFPVIWWYLWKASYSHTEILESDPITNTVAPEVSSKAIQGQPVVNSAPRKN